MRLGRRAPYPEHERPRLKLAAFLRTGALPPTPPVVDYVSKVGEWPMYANDEIGDCTTAAAGHMIEAWTAYGQGRTVQVTEADVIAAYSAVSGYDPRDPSTDQGAVMQDVLDYWRRTGIGGHRILAFAELDVTDLEQVRAALYLFGHVYVGVDFPQSAMDQFDAGRPWDVVRRSPILGGHAVDLGYAADGRNYACVTWGAVQELTPRWWSAYVEEAWVVASPEWVSATGGTPPGLDVAALGAAFEALTGEPSPFPAPVPDPTPTPQPTPMPRVGEFVHYVSYGTPGGEYASQCRAAVVTEVNAEEPGQVGLCVVNPGGLFFHPLAEGGCAQAEGQHSGGTWHWPEGA